MVFSAVAEERGFVIDNDDDCLNYLQSIYPKRDYTAAIDDGFGEHVAESFLFKAKTLNQTTKENRINEN